MTDDIQILPIPGFLGSSAAMRDVLRMLTRIARTNSTVLITGESGTGKELMARAVHAASHRADRPLVSVNCAALPEQLLESELFGHVKGAFTGAESTRKGLIEEAHQGTFFLDEVGEAPLPIQAKLLRVLDERLLRRVGDNRAIAVDVRIIAATNRDLEAEVRQRAFRDDLLHRLDVIRVHMPALRERPEDIQMLAHHFIDFHCRQLGRPLIGISPAALAALTGYSFPGNVRELSNIIEQAVALAAGAEIGVSDLASRLLDRRSSSTSWRNDTFAGRLRETVGSAEQEHIIRALRAVAWNVSRASTNLGISRNTLRSRIEKYGLRPPAQEVQPWA